MFDEDIVALVDDEVMRDHERIKFVSLDVQAGSKAKPRARAGAGGGRRLHMPTATGDGPVDATFNAIQAIFPHDRRRSAVLRGRGDRGHRRAGPSTVRLEEDGKMVDGQGADPDTIVASARAYVHALNKLTVKRLRTEPQALSA